MISESQKQTGVGIIILGFGIMIARIFIKVSWFQSIAKPIGYTALFVGCIWLIAGEQLMKILKIKSKQDKQYEGKSADEILEMKRKDMKLKVDEQKLNLELEQMKAKVEYEKAKTAKIKAEAGRINKQGSSKMPDVLGNLGPLLGGEEKKKDDFDMKKLL